MLTGLGAEHQIKVRFQGLRFVYLHRFMMGLGSYFSEIAAMRALVSTAVEAVGTSEESQTSHKDRTLFRYEVWAE